MACDFVKFLTFALFVSDSYYKSGLSEKIKTSK